MSPCLAADANMPTPSSKVGSTRAPASGHTAQPLPPTSSLQFSSWRRREAKRFRGGKTGETALQTNCDPAELFCVCHTLITAAMRTTEGFLLEKLFAFTQKTFTLLPAGVQVTQKRSTAHIVPEQAACKGKAEVQTQHPCGGFCHQLCLLVSA